MTSFQTLLRAPCRAIAAALLAGCAVAAHARSERQQAHACRDDALHFCSADVPNKAKITACMKQHYAQLSPKCKAMFDKPSAPSRQKG